MIYLVFGEAGTGKTTFALGGPKPVNYYEFDAGSFERAAEGIRLNEGDVNIHRYRAPLTNLLEQGRISVSNQGGIAPATVHKLSGWKEMFWEFVQDYLGDLQQPGYPVIDTGTKMWLAIRQSFLQEVQEAAGAERERLSTLQYTEPNARHSQIIEAAKAAGRDMVILSHEKEVYQNDKPTGVMTMDGFKEVPNMADCTLRFTLRNKKPVATIVKAGAGGLSLIGMELQEPTLESVGRLLKAAAALRRAGVAMDGVDAAGVVMLAERMELI